MLSPACSSVLYRGGRSRIRHRTSGMVHPFRGRRARVNSSQGSRMTKFEVVLSGSGTCILPTMMSTPSSRARVPLSAVSSALPSAVSGNALRAVSGAVSGADFDAVFECCLERGSVRCFERYLCAFSCAISCAIRALFVRYFTCYFERDSCFRERFARSPTRHSEGDPRAAPNGPAASDRSQRRHPVPPGPVCTLPTPGSVASCFSPSRNVTSCSIGSADVNFNVRKAPKSLFLVVEAT